jgi:diguanylate cyclase (GGDEF)-like protein
MTAKSGSDRHPTRSRQRRRTWLFASLGLAAIATSAALSSYPLLTGHRELRQVRNDDLALRDLSNLRTALSDFQIFVEPRMANLEPATATDLGNAALLAQAVPPLSSTVTRALQATGLNSAAHDLQQAQAAFTTAYSKLDVLAPGKQSPKVAAAITGERAAFAQIWAVTATVQTQLDQARVVDTQEGMVYLDDGRAAVLWVDGLAAALAVLAAFILGERVRRGERDARATARRRDFDLSVQRALEMADAEPAVYGIVHRALHQTVPHLDVEMLVADSSRAHFRQMVRTSAGPAEHSPCGVMSPLECPATMQGHTLVFPSSEEIDACPYLQDRSSGRCSAVCIPIGIAGKTVGVMHASGPDQTPPTDADIGYIELTCRRAAERIGMLRAFEKSEMQAHRDPLTGLMNRRSLANQIQDLQQQGIPYAVAYGDLDHFKTLNDTYGHEAGDQALRTFSRVLRDAVRPNDISARYGGEEFVVVLPDCSADSATEVLERVRERLALEFSSGRVPAFSVSFGVATAADAVTFDEIVAIADRALLAAKSAGRDRVLVAGTPTSPAFPGNADPEASETP